MGEIKLQIQKVEEDLQNLGIVDEPIPGMINSTNALRMNEYLIKSNKIKSDLIFLYGQYTKQLEEIAQSLLAIQTDLRDILKTEISMINSTQTDKKRVKKTNPANSAK